ncbi:MAG: GNAT family N-acetyltransferase [Nitriliruptoraceae bacterium]|nr:GNAT family N-acetyltransferase [Nitriliruptoraceae bacterium]
MHDERDTVRPSGLGDGEELAFLRAMSGQFHEDESDAELERYVPVVERDRTIVARDGERIVGTYAVRTATLSVPGGAPVACAGVTAVGVAQTHRRRGLLRAMMEQGLADARERGDVVAALYASEASIYGRFGFGVSARQLRYRLDRAGVRFRDPVEVGLVEPATVEQALATWPAILEAGVRAQRGGCLDMPAAHWQVWLGSDPSAARDGASARRLVHVPGRGYAAYRVKGRYTDVLPDGEVVLLQLVAADAEAEQALWQHVTDVDLTATVSSWLRPPDDALPWMITDPMRLRAGEAPPLYTRLLDVPAALAARTYRAPGAVTVRVHDRLVGSHTYRLEVASDGRADCAEVTDADTAGGHHTVDLECSLESLSSVWLGGVRVCELRAARRLVEHTDGAVARLDAMVAVDRLPWTPFEF